jgi:uncharacterized protein
MTHRAVPPAARPRLRLDLGSALLVLAAWLLLTVGTGLLLARAPQQALADTVSGGVGLPWVLALLLLAGVARAHGDRRALGLQAPAPHSWRLLWLPLAYACAMLALDAANGWPAPRVLLFVAINTALVGLSEELMFRGVLFAGCRARLALWPAMLLSSALFGAAHALNVLATGQLEAALLQSACAFLQGFGYLAIRLRTGSLWPVALVHALWDFSLVAGLLAPRTGEAPAGAVLLGPLLVALPMFLYGLFLMRGRAAPTSLSLESKS